MDDANRSRRILVVDDEDVIRGVISQVLSDDGHDVVEAANAEQALEAFQSEPFPLVMTDIYMGGMNGIELLQQLRQRHPDCQVVIMTSNASLDTATSALRAGAYDYLMKPFEDIDQITAVVDRAIDRINLIEENHRLVEQLRNYARELERLNEKLQEQADSDGLTGLYNHRYFRQVLEQHLVQPEDDGPFSLLFMDIDHFKIYNDTHGHLAGDEVLKQIAAMLVRETPECSTVARYGGEEFVILLPRVDKAGATSLAESVRRSVAEREFHGGHLQPLGRITLSLGVATCPDDGNVGATLIDGADRALYRAKRQGRNQSCCCEILMSDAFLESPSSNPQDG